MIPVSAPPRVREWLRQVDDGPVRILHRGLHAVYVEVAGRCVGLVGTRATAVPCALRCAAGDLGGLGTRSARIRDGVLHLDGTPLVVGRIVDVRVPRLAGWGDTHGRNGGARAAPTTVSSVGVGLGPEEVAELVGRGDGLTPYGDDVLCGWLAIHRAAGVSTPRVDAAVEAALGRTTLLSATLLECALHGEVIPEFAAYVAALGTHDETDRTARLARVGHTSGNGLLEGARLALGSLGRWEPAA